MPATNLPVFGDLACYWPDLAGSWPDDANLVDWYRQTHSNLVRVLESAPADTEGYTFLPAPSPLTMWARRQASEIAIHRFDAELSRGLTSEFAPAFASDMLDELLCGFGPSRRPLAVAGDKVFHVHADDTDEHWYITAGPARTVRGARRPPRPAPPGHVGPGPVDRCAARSASEDGARLGDHRVDDVGS